MEIVEKKQEDQTKEEKPKADPEKSGENQEKKQEESKRVDSGDELNTIMQNPKIDGWGQQTKQQ